MQSINKKSQFYFLFIILSLAVLLFFIKQIYVKEVNDYSLYKINFESELPYVVNYALYNNLDVFEQLLKYIVNFRAYLNRFFSSVNLAIFFYYQNKTFIYSDFPITLYLPDGSMLNLNMTNVNETIPFSYFQYEFKGQMYNLNFNRDFQYEIIFQLS